MLDQQFQYTSSECQAHFDMFRSYANELSSVSSDETGILPLMNLNQMSGIGIAHTGSILISIGVFV